MNTIEKLKSILPNAYMIVDDNEECYLVNFVDNEAKILNLEAMEDGNEVEMNYSEITETYLIYGLTLLNK